jgi:predicted RNase H-like HicB family nuclease
MELALQIHIEQLPEGVYLAISDDLPGLVAQGRTVAETLEIARDVAKKLIEARREREGASLRRAATNCSTASPVIDTQPSPTTLATCPKERYGRSSRQAGVEVDDFLKS